MGSLFGKVPKGCSFWRVETGRGQQLWCRSDGWITLELVVKAQGPLTRHTLGANDPWRLGKRRTINEIQK